MSDLKTIYHPIFSLPTMTRRPNRNNRMSGPPSINSNIVVSHTFRFVSTSGTRQTISDTDLITVPGAVCTVANSTCSAIAGSFKIKRISIWSPPPSQGSAATCSVTWVGNNTVGVSNVERSDTSVSTAVPAYVTSAPPNGSAASFWNYASGQNLFNIVAPVGSIVDLQLLYVLNDNDITTATITVATGTLGQLYYFPLDGDGDVFTPVSLGSTT